MKQIKFEFDCQLRLQWVKISAQRLEEEEKCCCSLLFYWRGKSHQNVWKSWRRPAQGGWGCCSYRENRVCREMERAHRRWVHFEDQRSGRPRASSTQKRKKRLTDDFTFRGREQLTKLKWNGTVSVANVSLVKSFWRHLLNYLWILALKSSIVAAVWAATCFTCNL